MEMERKDTFRAVGDAVISEEKPATMEQGPAVLPTSDQIFLLRAVTGVLVHVEEAMTKLVLETLTTQHKGVDNHLSAALESLKERIVRKVVRSTQVIAKIEEAVIDSLQFTAPTAGFVKWKQRK